jgi:hypothetical protein
MDHNTVKDRYLFLFSDCLVLAKQQQGPANPGESRPDRSGQRGTRVEEQRASRVSIYTMESLKNYFQVKKVAHVNDLVLSQLRKWDDSIWSFPQPQLLQEAFKIFAEDPLQGLHLLMQSHVLGSHPTDIAQFIHQHFPELPPRELGSFLGHPDNFAILQSFLEQFKFQRRTLAQSIRLFFRTFKIPSQKEEIDTLFRQFGESWYEANAESLTFDIELTQKLVYATMNLDKSNYTTSRMSNMSTVSNAATSTDNKKSIITEDKFINKIRSKDHYGLIPKNLLKELYKDISSEKIDMGVSETSRASKMRLESSSFPVRLTADTPSEWISIYAPNVDQGFQLQVLSTSPDLIAEPPMLDFSYSPVQKFRLIPKGAVGYKMVLFLNVGPHARRYLCLPSRIISVERKFMENVFQIVIQEKVSIWKQANEPPETLTRPRRFLFSVDSKEAQTQWTQELAKVITRKHGDADDKSEAGDPEALAKLVSVSDSSHTPGFSMSTLPRTSPVDHRNNPLPLSESDSPLFSTGDRTGQNEQPREKDEMAALAKQVEFQVLQNTVLIPAGVSLCSLCIRQTNLKEDKSYVNHIPPRLFTAPQLVRTVVQSSLIQPVLQMMSLLLKNPGNIVNYMSVLDAQHSPNSMDPTQRSGELVGKQRPLNAPKPLARINVKKATALSPIEQSASTPPTSPFNSQKPKPEAPLPPVPMDLNKDLPEDDDKSNECPSPLSLLDVDDAYTNLYADEENNFEGTQSDHQSNDHVGSDTADNKMSTEAEDDSEESSQSSLLSAEIEKLLEEDDYEDVSDSGSSVSNSSLSLELSSTTDSDA